jgi:Leucine-rich repeat (LRR) protein
VSALSGLSGLTALHLPRNRIGNITGLAELGNLTELSLQDNEISEIASLSRLTGLTHLRLDSNRIGNITALSGLVELIVLGLEENGIEDISPLSGLNGIAELYLRDNRIGNISALAGLTDPTCVDLAENLIEDIEPLLATRIGPGDTVDLRDNPLNEESLTVHIPELERRGVDVMWDASGSWAATEDVAGLNPGFIFGPIVVILVVAVVVFRVLRGSD